LALQTPLANAVTASLQLSSAKLVVLDLLAQGAFSPVQELMRRDDVHSVVSRQKLSDGQPFPVPIVLPVQESQVSPPGTSILLRDVQNRLFGILHIQEVFPLDPAWAGTVVPSPAMDDQYALSGWIECMDAGRSASLSEFSPGRVCVSEMLADASPQKRVLAIESWNVSDPRQTHALRRWAEHLQATVLLNLCDRETQVDDFDRFYRLRRVAQAAATDFSKHRPILNVIGFQPAPADERLILLHALMHKNYGADVWLMHLPTQREQDPARSAWWTRLAERCRHEYGIELVFPQEESEQDCSFHAAKPRVDALSTSGLCIWLTGLSGAGKSIIAEKLTIQLMEQGRRVTLLDGDVVRTHLSKGLTFSKQDRHLNICRIGFVAAEIVRHGGVAVCAAVSPYQASREAVRQMMPEGTFIEVFVDTPLAVCESRDAKGLYAQARSGTLPAFTGLTDPYETPLCPEVHLAAHTASPWDAAHQVMAFLFREGYLAIG
jgi:sulfate adenylyltransferase